ncbi:MAG: hypothetical protein JXR30_02485 [Alphaproteobacteria bacterium]|nr:hypothetical protein [Alphaproteobacteria bacterium]
MKKVLVLFLFPFFYHSPAEAADLGANTDERLVSYSGWSGFDGLLMGDFLSLTNDVAIYDLLSETGSSVDLAGETGISSDYIDLFSKTLSITDSKNKITNLILTDTEIRDSIGNGILITNGLTLNSSVINFSLGSTIQWGQDNTGPDSATLSLSGGASFTNLNGLDVGTILVTDFDSNIIDVISDNISANTLLVQNAGSLTIQATTLTVSEEINLSDATVGLRIETVDLSSASEVNFSGTQLTGGTVDTEFQLGSDLTFDATIFDLNGSSLTFSGGENLIVSNDISNIIGSGNEIVTTDGGVIIQEGATLDVDSIDTLTVNSLSVLNDGSTLGTLQLTDANLDVANTLTIQGDIFLDGDVFVSAHDIAGSKGFYTIGSDAIVEISATTGGLNAEGIIIENGDTETTIVTFALNDTMDVGTFTASGQNVYLDLTADTLIAGSLVLAEATVDLTLSDLYATTADFRGTDFTIYNDLVIHITDLTLNATDFQISDFDLSFTDDGTTDLTNITIAERTTFAGNGASTVDVAGTTTINSLATLDLDAITFSTNELANDGTLSFGFDNASQTKLNVSNGFLNSGNIEATGDVVINSDVTQTGIGFIDDGSYDVGNVTVNGEWTIEAGSSLISTIDSLHVDEFTINGELDQTAGTITATNVTVASGDITNSGSGVYNISTLTTTGLSTYYITAIDVNSFENQGDLEVDSANFGFTTGSVKTVQNEGTLNFDELSFLIKTGETITGTGNLYIDTVFQNQGIISGTQDIDNFDLFANTTGSLTGLTSFYNDGSLLNGGTISNLGTYNQNSTGTSENTASGVMSVNAFDIEAGTFINNGSLTINSLGTISGILTNDGNLTGQLDVSSGGVLNQTGLGNVTVAYDVDLSGNYDITGTLGLLTYNGTLVMQDSGTITHNNNFTIGTTGVFDLTQTSNDFDLGGLTNNGRIKIDASGDTQFLSSSFTNNGVIESEAGAYFEIDTDFINNGQILGKGTFDILAEKWIQQRNNAVLAVDFRNFGIFKFGAGLSKITFQGTFDNYGTLSGQENVSLNFSGVDAKWIENNAAGIDVKEFVFSNGATFDLNVDKSLNGDLKMTDSVLDLDSNTLTGVNSLSLLNTEVLINFQGGDGDTVIQTDNVVQLRNVGFDFTGSNHSLDNLDMITLVQAGGSLYSRDLYLVNVSELFSGNQIAIFDYTNGDLNLKTINKMVYETDFDLSENNTNMAEVMTVLQDEAVSTEDFQLLTHFATVAASGDQDALALALEEIRPQNIDATMKTGQLITDSVLNQLTTHVETNSRQASFEHRLSLPTDSVWFDISAIDSQTERVGDFKPYETMGATFTLGRETAFMRDKFFGGVVGSLSILKTEGKDDNAQDPAYTIDSQAMTLSAYTQYLTKYVSFYGILGGSLQRHDQERTTFLKNTATSDYSSTNFFGRIGAELAFSKYIVPTVFVSHQKLGAVDYEETGATGENLSVKGGDVALTQMGAGLRLQTELREADLTILPYLKVETRTTISGDDGVEFKNEFVDNQALPSFVNTTNPFASNATVLGAGVDLYEAMSATKTTLYYQMTDRDAATDHQLGVQINMMF